MCSPEEKHMKTLIQNGLLADPASALLERGDLLIEDGKIAALHPENPAADRIIDAQGRIVCPGFIDIHMHEDPVGPDGKIESCIFHSMLRMGVTTAVGGNCGLNVYDPGHYLDIVDRHGAPVNVALFAGHGYFRECAGAQDKYVAIAPRQQEKMLAGLQSALQAGCMGISFGLRYVPGTDQNEFYAAAQLCQAGGHPISAHVRDDAAAIFAAVDEVARAGHAFGIPVQISHIGSMGGFGQMGKLLEQIDAYRADGLDIACDCYPYTAFSTRIGETTYDDGWLDRYACTYSACVPASGKYRGQPCTRETFEELRRDDPECITVCYVMRGEDVEMALRHPAVMLASDGLLENGEGHPRASGSFPRFWREYVCRGGMDLLPGLAKMTSMPADRLGLSCKGRLQPGADADIVIFDPQRLADCARFDAPALPPEGIDYVLIGGEVALKNGEIQNAALGRSVRRA